MLFFKASLCISPSVSLQELKFESGCAAESDVGNLNLSRRHVSECLEHVGSNCRCIARACGAACGAAAEAMEPRVRFKVASSCAGMAEGAPENASDFDQFYLSEADHAHCSMQRMPWV